MRRSPSLAPTQDGKAPLVDKWFGLCIFYARRLGSESFFVAKAILLFFYLKYAIDEAMQWGIYNG